jgi:hypothetical protein
MESSMRMRSLVLGGAAAVAVVLAAAGSASAATVGNAGGDVTASGPTASEMTVSPASLNFAAQAVRTPSASRTVTITNTSSQPAFISGPNVNDYDFGISGSTCQAVTLAVGASCTVSVFFYPITQGTRSGTMSVVVGAYPDLTVVAVPISGEGLS